LKHYNKGIAAHMIAILELVDDDHLVFTNVNGVGPIDIVTVNTKTGKVDLYDAKSDRESRHYKRPINDIQKVEDGFIPGVQYSKKELEEIFEKDFAIAIQGANKLVGDFDIDDDAFGVVVEMCFQLGFPRVLKFKFFLAALKIKDYEKAAEEMLLSKWHEQTPSRCQELSNIMRSCE